MIENHSRQWSSWHHEQRTAVTIWTCPTIILIGWIKLSQWEIGCAKFLPSTATACMYTQAYLYTRAYHRHGDEHAGRKHLSTHAANQIKYAIVASRRRRACAQDFRVLGVSFFFQEIVWNSILRPDSDSEFLTFNQIHMFRNHILRKFMMEGYRARPNITVNASMVSVTMLTGKLVSLFTPCSTPQFAWGASSRIVHIRSSEEGFCLPNTVSKFSFGEKTHATLSGTIGPSSGLFGPVIALSTQLAPRSQFRPRQAVLTWCLNELVKRKIKHTTHRSGHGDIMNGPQQCPSSHDGKRVRMSGHLDIMVCAQQCPSWHDQRSSWLDEVNSHNKKSSGWSFFHVL